MRPLGKRVLVKRPPAKDKMVGSILVTEEAQKSIETMNRGIVVALGSDGDFTVEVGDKVILSGSPYGVTPVVVDDEEMILINEEDIIGIETE